MIGRSGEARNEVGGIGMKGSLWDDPRMKEDLIDSFWSLVALLSGFLMIMILLWVM